MKDIKKLTFKGLGWVGVESNGVGNCRISTRLSNIQGRQIYLELCFLNNKENGFEKGFVYHCFDIKDERTNYTKDLAWLQGMKFTYDLDTILKLVNNELNCDYDTIEIFNKKEVI